jgi:two-component system, chemotaxis family, chemotaxis protein CheY
LFGKFRVLAVEDDNATRLMLRRMLETLEFAAVETAASVDGAKLAFQAPPEQWPNVVLCDVDMKPENGLDFVAWLRAQPMGQMRKTPVVMVTAHAHAALVRRAMELGVSGYLVKPVGEAALRTRLERAIEPLAFGPTG